MSWQLTVFEAKFVFQITSIIERVTVGYEQMVIVADHCFEQVKRFIQLSSQCDATPQQMCAVHRTCCGLMFNGSLQYPSGRVRGGGGDAHAFFHFCAFLIIWLMCIVVHHVLVNFCQSVCVCVCVCVTIKGRLMAFNVLDALATGGLGVSGLEPA